MKRSITNSQIFKLFSLYLVTTMVAFVLGSLKQVSLFDAPLGVIFGMLGGMVLVYGATRFGLKRPGESFAEYGQTIVGRVLHTVFMIYLLLTYLGIAVVNLWGLQDFLTQFYLSNTPEWAVLGLCGLCIAYTARKGTNTVFRAAEGLFLLCILSFIVIPFLIEGYFDWPLIHGYFTMLHPSKIWPAAFKTLTIYGELSLIIFLMPYLRTPDKAMRSLWGAAGSSIAIVVQHLVAIMLIFGPALGTNLNYLELEVLRFMRSESFLETLDPALIALWVISIFVKLSLLMVVSGHILSRVCGLPSGKPLIFPLMLFVIIGTLNFFKSHAQYQEASQQGLMLFLLIGELIPILYLVVDAIRRPLKNKKKPSPKKSGPQPASS